METVDKGNSFAANYQRHASKHDTLSDMSVLYIKHAINVSVFILTYLTTHVELRLTCYVLCYFQSIPSVEGRFDWYDSGSNEDTGVQTNMETDMVRHNVTSFKEKDDTGKIL